MVIHYKICRDKAYIFHKLLWRHIAQRQ